jgi:Ser/Thr protein kinase RdoA (MazF antagonist)
MPPAATAPDILNAQWEPCPIPEVEALALAVFGKGGSARRLTSERDETFKLTTKDEGSFTLKIANPVEDVRALAFQSDVFLHLATTPLEVPVPRLVPTLGGEPSHALMVPGGSRVLRLLTYLKGELMGASPASPALCHQLGLALGSLSAALSGATARPPAGKLLWDLTHFHDLEARLGFVDPERRPRVQAVLDAFADRVLPVLGDLPAQVIHNDFNPYNILVDPRTPDAVVGIIDFGDMVYGARVNDLAVAAAYHLFSDDWAEKLSDLLRGFSAVVRLTPAEIEVLPTLIAARLAMTVIITEWRASLRPDESTYILRNHRSAWLGLASLAAVPDADLRQLIHDSCKA